MQVMLAKKHGLWQVDDELEMSVMNLHKNDDFDDGDEEPLTHSGHSGRK
jgi:hypothetical protein